MNEQTFAGWLVAATRLRSERMEAQGIRGLIFVGEIEEKEIDPSTGRVVRCDLRLNDRGGGKLVSGELKRPERPEGRDPRAEPLRQDARRKALARGLPLYFTCNMAEVVVFSLPSKPGDREKELLKLTLADIHSAVEAESIRMEIEEKWIEFLDRLEDLLVPFVEKRPRVTRTSVLQLKEAIDGVVGEGMARAERYLTEDPNRLQHARQVTATSFGLAVALNPSAPSQFREELVQVLRLNAFVVVQKLILYNVLSESGPKRPDNRFTLDPLKVPATSTDPIHVKRILDWAERHAIERSGDYETAFLTTPEQDLLFVPCAPQEIPICKVGLVWDKVLAIIQDAAWSEASRSLVGFLYEAIIEPRFRHELGQYYTNEDVVDLLTAFAVRSKWDVVLDPASGGGSFVSSVYQRKLDLGASHLEAMSEIWATEVTAFAAQLTSITLATANIHEPAAYPQVLLRDFFLMRRGAETGRKLPGNDGPLRFPETFDCVVGNPPYISYRRQTNQKNIVGALTTMRKHGMSLPHFSGKSDEYVWFIVFSTMFLVNGGRLAFVVSSAILFADYSVPLVRFLGRYFRIAAVVDSAVEQWFEDADTNTVLLLLEREIDPGAREESTIRFVRMRQRLSRLIPASGDSERREAVESLVEAIRSAKGGTDDPRFQVNLVTQGKHGGLGVHSSTEDWHTTEDDAEHDSGERRGNA